MNGITLIETFARFLRRQGLVFETFAAHLRLDILSPREAWALRHFAAISGGSTVGTDLRDALSIGISIPPQTATGTVSGTGVDMNEADGPIHGLLVVGAVSGTGPSLDVRYQASDTSGGTYADIGVPGSVHPQVVASSKCSWADFKRPKRWVRAVATVAGGSPSFSVSVALFGVPKTRY
jgi:hypothetical protein